MGDVGSTVISVTPLVCALVALVRKHVPRVDGPWVVLLAMVLGVGLSCLATWQQHTHDWAGAIMAGVGAAVGALGGTEYLSRLAGKARPQ